MRAVFAISLVVVSVATALPASADWQFTHWGMNRAELVKAAGEKVIAVQNKDGASFEMPYSADSFTFTAEFFFDNSGGLCKVQLKLRSGDPIALRDALAEKYGVAPQSQYPSLYSLGAIWKTQSDEISFINEPGGSVGNTWLTYERRVSSGL
jgi:hypothetical protein